jgi:hypothetical protein
MSTKTIAALLIAVTPVAAACAASPPLPVYTPPSANPVTIAPVPEGASAPVPEVGVATYVPEGDVPAHVPSNPEYVPRLEREAGPQPTQPEQTVEVPLTPVLPSEVITSEVIATEESTSESTTPLPTPSLTGE